MVQSMTSPDTSKDILPVKAFTGPKEWLGGALSISWVGMLLGRRTLDVDQMPTAAEV